MDSTVIHETIIRDILDMIEGLEDIESTVSSKRDNSYRSIAQASSNLTLVFPVITSKNININNAAMISKALERKAVTMLQMLFAAVNITDAENGIDYIKNFHTNLKIDDSITVDSFIDAMDSFTANEGVTITDATLYEMAKRDLKNLNYYLPDSVNESSLNGYYFDPRGNYGRGLVINEADNKKKNKVPKRVRMNNNNSSKEDSRANKDSFDMTRNQLQDSDVKKANELIPSMMVVNFIKTSKDSTEAIHSNLVIGVKAKLYPVDSEDMMNRIIIKNEDNNGFLKLVKATTREISFLKDFLLAIERAKIDALSHSRRGSSSKLWKILERRALKSRIRRGMGSINDASAISTLVISNEEVEFLKKTEGIDVMEPRVIRPIMEAYNLMGVCVVDESVEAAHFIFDTGSDIYETVPFSGLEREARDGSYKKIVNLMNKVNR